MKSIQLLFQLGLIIVISEIGKYLSTQFHLPLPGNIVGMLLLFILLLTGLVPLKVIERGANLMLKYMALFFIPAGVALIGHWGTIQSHLIGFVAVVAFSTLIVLIATGKITDAAIRIQNRLKKKGDLI